VPLIENIIWRWETNGFKGYDGMRFRGKAIKELLKKNSKS
jgi:hypothetical protein